MDDYDRVEHIACNVGFVEAKALPHNNLLRFLQ